MPDSVDQKIIDQFLRRILDHLDFLEDDCPFPLDILRIRISGEGDSRPRMETARLKWSSMTLMAR